MLFNSVEFLVFLPVVFSLYWLVNKQNIRLQNYILVISSYFFYGWWDWRFLALIAFSSLVDYLIGLALGRTEAINKRKLLLVTSITVNIGFLAFFKYFNFFVESFQKAFTFLGVPISDPLTINVILPVGISFYTFQTLSYTFDIYRKKLQPTKDIVSFFAFVSFFPQLVAGPIERATNLLPQFRKQRIFNCDLASDGMRQILWGLFKKIVIADNCAIHVNHIFSNYAEFSGSTLLVGAILFSFQIYCDFSGYSDIAIGTARLFGFSLMKNFNFPYFSRDIAEFWRRWHISLSTWFKEYIYIPLGGSRKNILVSIRNVFIIFIISGFWHGANWTFIIWGILNAVYFLPIMLIKKNRIHMDTVAQHTILPNSREIVQISTTFFLTTISWIFFRSETVADAIQYVSKIFSYSLFTYPEIFPKKAMAFIVLLVFVEWFQRHKNHALQIEKRFNRYSRWFIYYAIVILMIEYGGEAQEFVYFQF